MSKLLVICPTRQRPDVFRKMIYSFEDMTSSNSELIAIVDLDDPCIEEYREIHDKNGKFKLIESQDLDNTKRFNNAFKMFSYYDFYCMANDDFLFKTKDWDLILCRKWKISYGNDLLGGQALPTCPVIDGDIVREIGWLQMPSLTYMYGDTAWRTIGTRLNILKYFPNVIIEHCHWMNHKSQIDEVYKVTNSARTYEQDEKAFRQWKEKELDNDVKKIKDLLELRKGNQNQ